MGKASNTSSCKILVIHWYLTQNILIKTLFENKKLVPLLLYDGKEKEIMIPIEDDLLTPVFKKI